VLRGLKHLHRSVKIEKKEKNFLYQVLFGFKYLRTHTQIAHTQTHTHTHTQTHTHTHKHKQIHTHTHTHTHIFFLIVPRYFTEI